MGKFFICEVARKSIEDMWEKRQPQPFLGVHLKWDEFSSGTDDHIMKPSGNAGRYKVGVLSANHAYEPYKNTSLH